MDETALAEEVRRLTDEKQELREALADVIFAAVLHPELPGLELVSGAVLDRARLFIKNDSDMAAAAERAVRRHFAGTRRTMKELPPHAFPQRAG